MVRRIFLSFSIRDVQLGVQKNQELKDGASLFFVDLIIEVGNGRMEGFNDRIASSLNMFSNNLESFIKSDPRIGRSMGWDRRCITV